MKTAKVILGFVGVIAILVLGLYYISSNSSEIKIDSGVEAESSCEQGCTQDRESILNVASFNMRYDNSGDGVNVWANRREWIASFITFSRFDIIGTQELLHHQLMDIDKLLPGYSYIGVGRDDGEEAGEYAAILYREAKYDVLDSGTSWLAEDDTVPGVLGWDAVCSRVLTWAKFKKKDDGKIFFVLNTHFDHVGEVARLESSKMILKRCEELSKEGLVIVTGDFNADYNSTPYVSLTEGVGELKPIFDVKKISPIVYGPNWTFNSFGKGETEVDGKVIDHLFISDKSRGAVNRFATFRETIKDRYISDHYPIYAEIVLK